MPIKTGVAVTQENVSGKLCWLSAPANITLQGWKTCSNFTNEQVKIAKNKKSINILNENLVCSQPPKSLSDVYSITNVVSLALSQ